MNDEKETYTMKDFYNPLIGMDYPDPDLIRVGDLVYDQYNHALYAGG